MESRKGTGLAGTIEAEKRAAAEAAALRVTDGMVVGLGTGSTADFAIRTVGERVAAGLRISGVPTSRRSEDLARRLGIPLVALQDVERIDLTIDGADEIDSESLALIKGQGGALVREKLVAVASNEVIIVADASKIVERLGGRHPVPVEVLPYGWRVPATRIGKLGGASTLRTDASDSPFVTDNGNYILDVVFGPIERPDRLAQALKALTGVVDHGLFIDIADRALVATGDHVREYLSPRDR
jgi:ribose 5-phosphate isomerase A